MLYGLYMIVITLSSLPNISLKEKYFSTLGSFLENKCSMEKSIFSFGIDSARIRVVINTKNRVILGWLMTEWKNRFNIFLLNFHITSDVYFSKSYLKGFLDHKLKSSRSLNVIGPGKPLLIITESTFLTGIIPDPLFVKNNSSTRLISNILSFS